MIIRSSKNTKPNLLKAKEDLIISQAKNLDKNQVKKEEQFSIVEKKLNETVLEDDIVEIQDNRVEAEKPVEEDENLNQWLEGALED